MLTLANGSLPQIGFGGGAAGTGVGGLNGRGRSTESPASAFQMFLGGNEGTPADTDASAVGRGNGEEVRRSLGQKSPDGSTMPVPPVPVRGSYPGWDYKICANRSEAAMVPSALVRRERAKKLSFEDLYMGSWWCRQLMHFASSLGRLDFSV